MRSFVFSLIMMFVANSHAGVEAIQLDHVPIDVALKCDRIFFRSTQHFTGTIYALPRIIVDRDEYYDDIVRVTKNPKETAGKPYIIGFKVYFPRDDEEIKTKSDYDQATQFKACNFDQVKTYLNSVDPKNPIHTVASMPITSFEISLPDFLASSKLVGRTNDNGDADIIDYQGRTYNFVYEITEKEAQSMMDAFQSGEGLQARVRFKFQARRRDGSLSVRVDTAKLAANFETNVKAKYKIAKGDIEAALRLAMEDGVLEINMQEGSPEFASISNKIIDKVLAELNFTIKDIEPGASPKVEDSDAEVDVKLVANIIRSKVSQSIEFNNVKAAEEASAESPLELNTGSLDPSITQVRVVSGEGDVSLNEPVRVGNTISIIPAFHSSLFIEYVEKVSYLSVEQMKSDSYSKYFQKMLTSGQWNFRNDDRNGVRVGIASPAIMFSNPLGIGAEYAWRRVELSPQLARNPRQTMEAGLDQFDRFPITVAFTGVGNQRKRFKFKELIGENPYWQACYDDFTGTLHLTAKKDLGLMVFKERFLLTNKNNDSLAEEKDQNDPDFARKIVETETLIRETRTLLSITDSAPVSVRTNTKATTRRRAVYFNITRPKTSALEACNAQ